MSLYDSTDHQVRDLVKPDCHAGTGQAVRRGPGASGMARARGPVHGNINNTAYRQGFCRYVVAIPRQEAVGGAMERITSRTNPLITRIRKLTGDRKYRRREGVMVCEGPKMLAEALRWGAGWRPFCGRPGPIPPLGCPGGPPGGGAGTCCGPVAPTETPSRSSFWRVCPPGPCRRN